MSTSPTPKSTLRSKKVLIPKVWKRPHSTIYGKNVQFGSSLYSDKIGEINGRKFNSELPWQVRNSGSSSLGTSSGLNQGYLSNLLINPEITLIGSVMSSNNSSGSRYTSNTDTLNKRANSCHGYADLLELTNPSRYSKRRNLKDNGRLNTTNGRTQRDRIDFYDQYMDFSKEIDRLSESSLLMNEPLLRRKAFDNFLDFDYELGLFVPSHNSSVSSSVNFGGDGRSLLRKNTLKYVDDDSNINDRYNELDINKTSFVPLITTTQQTKLLPKHHCQLASSPYGQSADGRKLSLGSINPQSYRPTLPQKTSTVHASDGEEFEFQDRSSPFYTDR